jgi:hypothetical protein
MITLTYLPSFTSTVFQGMPGVRNSQHCLLLYWLIVLQVLYPGRKTLAELTPWTPKCLTARRLTWRLKGSYWSVGLRVEWWAHDGIHTLPPPEDDMRYEIGDGSHKPKRGVKNPVAQKDRQSQHHPWFFGFRFALSFLA